MAITLHDYQQDSNASATSLSINTNGFGSRVVGDLMVAQFTVGSTGAAQTLPSGWTAITDTGNSGGNSRRMFLSYKYMDSSDVTGQVIQWSHNAGATATQLLVLHIKGMRTVSAIGASSGQGNTASTTVTAPTVTPTEANSMIVFFASFDNNPSTTISGYALATSSPSFTEVTEQSVSSNFATSAAYGIRPEITATGSGTATLSQSMASIGQLLVVSAPQSFTLADTTSLTDSTRYNLSSLIRDTITLTDSITATMARLWNNAVKTASTWINQDKTDN